MCDTMVVVEPGRVLFAKNSDRDPNEAQVIEWHPARSHRRGSTVRCTWIDIPQVGETHAAVISRPFWMWGAEMGANEHGVTIGNEAVFTTQPYAKTGLTGMDLLRLALERADTARRAVDVIVDLLDRHGQGGGCGHENRRFTYHNSFLVADPTGAFILETAGSKWEIEEVREGARSISNGLTIPGFADRHSDRLKTAVSACRKRRPLTQAAAGRSTQPLDLVDILRDHDAGEPRYSPLNGAMAAPCMHAGGLAAASQTTASWVAELTPAGSRHWATGTAAPCTGIFKPVSIDRPIDTGPPPTDRYDPASLWWRHERLHRVVLRDPERTVAVFEEERDELEAGWLSDHEDPARAWAVAAESLERWTERVPVPADRRPAYVRRYWTVRNRRAGLEI